VSGRELISNTSDFKTPAYLVITDATPERKFTRELCNREYAAKIDAWLKNTPMGFYTIEYAWKKGEHPKRGEFSPDFFLKQGNQIFVVEIKDNEQIKDPLPENVKKHEYARAHFERLNGWLKKRRHRNVLPIQHGFPKRLRKVLHRIAEGKTRWIPFRFRRGDGKSRRVTFLSCRI